MRLYQNCAEMHSEELRNIIEMGTLVHPQTMQDRDVSDLPDYDTLELSPAAFVILDGSDRDEMLRKLNLPQDWARHDFEERVVSIRMPQSQGINPGEAWRLRAEVWKPFIHNGKFAYTYSERFSRHVVFDVGALRRVLEELRQRPNTRQAVLPIFDAMLDLPNIGGQARVPCSMYYQFLRRRGELDMVYTMRSTDFMTHFPMDIWMALELQTLLASMLGVASGRLQFFSGSLHIYKKDAPAGVF